MTIFFHVQYILVTLTFYPFCFPYPFYTNLTHTFKSFFSLLQIFNGHLVLISFQFSLIQSTILRLFLLNTSPNVFVYTYFQAFSVMTIFFSKYLSNSHLLLILLLLSFILALLTFLSPFSTSHNCFNVHIVLI